MIWTTTRSWEFLADGACGWRAEAFSGPSPPPAGTPADIIARLDGEVSRACAAARLREAFAQQAAIPAPSTAEEMRELLERGIAPWKGVTTRAKVSVQQSRRAGRSAHATRVDAPSAACAGG